MKLFLVGAYFSVIFSVLLEIYSVLFIPLEETQIGFTNDGLVFSQYTIIISMLFGILYQVSKKK